MGSMTKWMLGAVVLAGAMGLGATKANAAQFGVYVNAPEAYVPPCPGPGYFWTAGYYDGGYWVPGRWEFRGEGFRDRVYYGANYYGYGHYDRDDHHFDRDRDRGWDRDRHFDRDRDGFRGHDDGFRGHDRR